MNEKTIYALGFFDGVHIGHGALLREAVLLSRELGLAAGAVTFGTHPEALVRGAAPGLINTPADRERLLRSAEGITSVVTLPFDQALRTMPWEDFLELLIREHGAAGFVCGDDFRFGHKGAGNAGLLKTFCESRGLPFRMVPEQTLEGIRVSSSVIRELLERGDVKRANRFLGHPHILSGRVVPGKQLGRRLGIPTANLVPPEELAKLRHGVYACRCRVEGDIYTAVTNVGNRPTVEGENVTVEPWLLGYSGDLYEKQIILEFHEFLRPEQKFDSLEALKAAIHADAAKAREILE